MNRSSIRDRCIALAWFFARRLAGMVAICALCIGLASLAASARQSTDDFASATMIASGGATDDPFGIDKPAGTPPTAAYAFDPAFAAHGYGIDRFSDSPSKNFYGRKESAVYASITHPISRTDGSRAGDAVLYSMYGGASPTSPFTVARNGRGIHASDTLSYLVGKFIPTSADRIFPNSFDDD